MALAEIMNIEMSEDGDSYVYEVSTSDLCTGDITLILSRTRSQKSETVIETGTDWEMACGTLTVKKEKLEGVKELYVYLRDDSQESGGATTTSVRVFREPFALLGVRITENDELIFRSGHVGGDRRFAKELCLTFKDGEGIQEDMTFPAGNARIPLERVIQSKETASFTFSLAYKGEDEGAAVFSAPCPDATVYIAPPELNNTTAEETEGKLIVTPFGNFTKDVPMHGWFYVDGSLYAEADLKDGKLDLGAFGVLPNDAEGTLELCYRTALGDSLHSSRVPVVLKKASGECRYCMDQWELRFADCDSYKVTYGGKETTVRDSILQVPQNEKECVFSVIRGASTGVQSKISLQERAIYRIDVGEGEKKQSFYCAADRPDEWSAGLDITAELAAQAGEGSSYSGAYFSLQSSGGKTILTIKKEIFTAEAATVHLDHISLLKAAGASDTDALYEEVCEVITRKLPLRAGEELFYRYGYMPENGVTGIGAGMRLLTEYTVYQNIPGAAQSNSDLSGFVGTGTAAYQVVERDGKLSVDPFASGMNIQVPSPGMMGSDRKLTGGAGLADLLYTGFSAAHMKLVYPSQFTDRHSTGNLSYDSNICLLTADRIADLEKAAVGLRAHGIGASSVSYHYFRGRSMVVPQVCILVNDCPVWVSLGTTLSDLMTELGGNGFRFYRIANGQSLEVKTPAMEMQFLPGDRVVTGDAG